MIEHSEMISILVDKLINQIDVLSMCAPGDSNSNIMKWSINIQNDIDILMDENMDDVKIDEIYDRWG